MIDQDTQKIFRNKESFGYKGIIENFILISLSIIFSYFFTSLISREFVDFNFYLKLVIIFLVIHYLLFLTRKHTDSVQFSEVKKELIIIQKNYLRKEYEFRVNKSKKNLLSSLSSSYGRVNFDIKQDKNEIYISSDQKGLSKKKVKKIYKSISEFLDTK